MPDPKDVWAAGDVPEGPEYNPDTLKGLLDGLAGRCDCPSCKREERERLAHVAAWKADRGYIEALETEVAEWEGAARYALAHYPEDAFPATGTSQDAKTGTFARGLLSRLLDPIERKQYTALETHIKEVERERDLAVAHDRQPYPTAEAYEAVCAALKKAKARIEAAAQIARADQGHWSDGTIAAMLAALASPPK